MERDKLYLHTERTLPFGMKDGRMWDATQVERGLDCGCVCPACGKRFVARQGDVRVWHFAHEKHSDCGVTAETLLHRTAKEIIERRKEILLPGYRFVISNDPNSPSFMLFEPMRVQLENVALEQNLHSIIPDIVAEVRGRRLFIEIAVTHFSEQHKIEKIRAMNVSAIEINLTQFRSVVTIAELERILIDGLKNEGNFYKYWLHNVRAEELTEHLLSITQPKLFEITTHRSKNHVHCPKQVREYNGKPYANADVDCVQCRYFAGADNKYVRCLASGAILGYDDFCEKYGIAAERPIVRYRREEASKTVKTYFTKKITA